MYVCHDTKVLFYVIDGESGFTEEELTALKAKALVGQQDDQKVVCSLMLDEIFFWKHVQYDGKKVPCYVDLGTVIEIHDPLPATTVHHHWLGCHNIFN